MDKWNLREGGERRSFGPNAALSHYIGKLHVENVAIFDKYFFPNGHFKVFALRTLSKLLCLSTIGNTVSSIILVKKALAINTFSSGFRGKVLAHLGICNAIGESDPAEITKSVLSGELPQAKKRKVDMLEKIRAIPPPT